MRSLLPLIGEGQNIAEGGVEGFRVRYGAWLRKVKDELQDAPLLLARFKNAQPITHAQPGPSGIAAHLRKLRGELAVLIELENDRPEAVTSKPELYGVHANPKEIWRNVRDWWKRPLDRIWD
jgi:hypothetical protein